MSHRSLIDNRSFCLCLQQIVEYDVLESLKESRGLVIAFHKRIFQSALPVSMTLVHNAKLGEDQLLIADTESKFKLFDKNTFEILATFLGPIYDSNVQQFVSINGATIQIDFDGLKVPLSSLNFGSFRVGCKLIAWFCDSRKVFYFLNKQKHLSLRLAYQWQSFSELGIDGSLQWHQMFQSGFKSATSFCHWK